MLSGCAALQNINAAQVREQRYFYKRFEIPKTIEGINSSLYVHSYSCQQLWTLQVDPANKREAQIVLVSGGLTKPSVIVVIDFHEASDAQTTMADAYSYYSTWHSVIDKIMSAINNPPKCT